MHKNVFTNMKKGKICLSIHKKMKQNTCVYKNYLSVAFKKKKKNAFSFKFQTLLMSK